MNMAKLQTFITLAECLNFTEAAEQLFCSQPSVSMQIQSLEHDLGVPLFDRIGKKLYLTKQGEQFKPYAEQMIHTLQAAKEHLQQLDDLSCGNLAFGASNFVGVYLLPSVLGVYNRMHPGIKINMNIASSTLLWQQLESNKLEFLVLSDQIPIDEARFEATAFARDELILIMPPGHRLAQQERCTVQELEQETIIVKPRKSATRSFLEQKFAERGVTFPREIEFNQLEAIKQGVVHGLGVSIVSKFAVKQELAGGLLACVPIEGLSFERGIRYVHYRNKHLSPAAKRMIALLDAMDA
ncbi:LysR family transcriptional regulator [Paenibacillus sp. MBLB4367]|uniref:LysR family transcriptional regulator n=1 Tax=Paenibacillus sp. MBLB4367 TaxID=3384767 RepID=UPI0039083143